MKEKLIRIGWLVLAAGCLIWLLSELLVDALIFKALLIYT